jgi:hypothetical protein
MNKAMINKGMRANKGLGKSTISVDTLRRAGSWPLKMSLQF